MTAASIGAAKGGGYARYLESKTIQPERGDYYLSPEGEPTQAPGRWLATPDTLARLGIEGERVEGRDFIALMEGRHPRSGAWLRREGAGGGRGGGIDLTFSAPKSVKCRARHFTEYAAHIVMPRLAVGRHESPVWGRSRSDRTRHIRGPSAWR